MPPQHVVGAIRSPLRGGPEPVSFPVARRQDQARPLNLGQQVDRVNNTLGQRRRLLPLRCRLLCRRGSLGFEHRPCDV